MKNRDHLKRIMAMAGVILIFAIWIATFVVGVTEGPKKLLTALFVLSVIVPVLLYAIILVARIVSGRPATDEIDAAIRSGRMNVPPQAGSPEGEGTDEKKHEP